jgi:hypothetical protein
VPPTISLRKLRSETARINEAVNANAAVFNDQVLPVLQQHQAGLEAHEDRLTGHDDRILRLEAGLRSFEQGSMWFRLRWLVTGRG